MSPGPSGLGRTFESRLEFPAGLLRASLRMRMVSRLRALVRVRNAPQKNVWRAQIVLLSAEGAGTNADHPRDRHVEDCTWRWQERLAAEASWGC